MRNAFRNRQTHSPVTRNRAQDSLSYKEIFCVYVGCVSRETSARVLHGRCSTANHCSAGARALAENVHQLKTASCQARMSMEPEPSTSLQLAVVTCYVPALRRREHGPQFAARLTLCGRLLPLRFATSPEAGCES